MENTTVILSGPSGTVRVYRATFEDAVKLPQNAGFLETWPLKR